MKYIFKIILCVVILFISIDVYAVTGSSYLYEDEELKYEKNWKIVQIATEVEKYLRNKYNIVDEFRDKYPSFFGGMYVSDDANYLVIKLVINHSPEDESSIRDIASLDDTIKYEYADYSFNELNSVNNYFSDYMEQNKGYINGAYIDVVSNRVVVELDQINKDITNIINKDRIDDGIILVNSEHYYDVHSLTTINAGGKFVISGSKYCSMGFRTKYNNKKGFVTAGHCLKNVNSVPSGVVKISHFSDNGYYDYGFVQINTVNYDITNNLAYHNSAGTITKLAVVNYCPSILANMSVAKVGVKTHYTSGTVVGLNQTVVYYNTDGSYYATIHGLVKTNVRSLKGDSGGVFFIPRTDSNGGAIPIGILSGGSPSEDDPPITFFTGINDLPTSLQTGRY